MKHRVLEAGESPPLSAERFKATPEFRKFKSIMRRLLSVPKVELDQMVQLARKTSPRAGNPRAPGRKPSSVK